MDNSKKSDTNSAPRIAPAAEAASALPHSQTRSAYLQPSNLIAAASALLAVIALGVSVRGCQVAHDANILAQRQYREERLLVLQGEFSEKNDTVTLRSISDGATFLEGRAYFPTEITKEEWMIRPSDRVLHLASAKFELQEAIKKRVPPKAGAVQFSPDGKIPVLIDAYYTSRGEAYQDRSIYLLGVEFLVGEDAFVPPTVKFTGLTFLRRLDAEKPVNRKILDEMLNAENGIYIPPRTPR